MGRCSTGVNVVLSNLKRSLDGAYPAFKFTKYAHRYLAETQCRFNRRFDLVALVPRLLVAAGGSSHGPSAACAMSRSSRLK
jgi:hypothetical protein